MDVEDHMFLASREYALLPALITNGGHCNLSMTYIEVQPPTFRTAQDLLVDLHTAAMENVFAQMRKASPKCTVKLTKLDDETYLHANTDVPAAPGPKHKVW
jgi:hypothetical protein